MALRKFVFFDANEGFVTEQQPGDDLSIGKLTVIGDTGIGIDAGSQSIINVPTPVNATDAVNKSYVDTLSQGISWKNPVRAATTAALATNTYANGTAGVGATLTATANGALAAQDGVTLIATNRLLVKNEATTANNGIYLVTQVGDSTHPYILTRATDDDQSTEQTAASVFIDEGSTLADTAYVQTTAQPITMGTTSITWTLFTSTQSTTASTGLVKVGNDIRVKPGDGIDVVSNSASTNVKLDGSTPGLKFTGSAGSGALATKNDTTRGLSVDASGNFAQVLTASGTGFDGSGNLKVVNDANGGLTLGSAGEKILLPTNSGLSVSSSGLVTAFAPAVESTYTANGAIAAKSGVYFSGNDVLDQAANTAAASSRVVGLAPAAISAAGTGLIITSGVATSVLTGATVNTPYYLGATGGLVLHAALASGARQIRMGFAKNATDLFVAVADLGQLG